MFKREKKVNKWFHLFISYLLMGLLLVGVCGWIVVVDSLPNVKERYVSGYNGIHNESLNSINEVKTFSRVVLAPKERVLEKSIKDENDSANDMFKGIIKRDSVPYIKVWDKIGYISCKSVNLHKVPIIYGWSQDICDNSEICMANYNNLKFSEGKISIICGHNYKALFELHNADVGDDVIIETTYGANYHYRIVKSCKVLLQETPNVAFHGFTDMKGNWVVTAQEDSNDLVIFTCFDMNDNDYRWFVRAEYVEGTTIEK